MVNFDMTVKIEIYLRAYRMDYILQQLLNNLSPQHKKQTESEKG